MVADALTPALLDGLNRDLDRIVAATAPGKSASFLEVMLLPLLCGMADHFLLPHCDDYLFNTGQLIEIGPGEGDQRLHRDDGVWRHVPAPGPELEVEALFALSDFTAANGSTRVAPGSHRWPTGREPEPDEIVQAEMKAGSALFYLGSTIHGGGANRTADDHRRGMFAGYVLGWLRIEESMFLSEPLETARAMPRRVQELLGYKAVRAMGVVDVGSPMALLD